MNPRAYTHHREWSAEARDWIEWTSTHTPIPAPYQYDTVSPYAATRGANGGNAVQDASPGENDAHQVVTDAHQVVTSPGARCLARVAFARAFDAAGPRPACVARRVAALAHFAQVVTEARTNPARLGGRRPSRRIRRALAAFDPADLATAYDPAVPARIAHYAAHQAARIARNNARAEAKKEAARRKLYSYRLAHPDAPQPRPNA